MSGRLLEGHSDAFDYIILIKDVTINTEPKHQILDDFSRLLSDEESKDVSFKFGTEELTAHKLILAARSPVFKRMFEVDMKEKCTSVIEISDATSTAFKSFLKFIYSGHYDKRELSPELLYLGEKYEINDLKEMAAKGMLEKLNVKTAIDTLIHFDLHGIHQSKVKAAKFIAQNKEIAYTDEKKQELETTHPDLAHLVQMAIDLTIN